MCVHQRMISAAAGFEPGSPRLKVSHATNELSWRLNALDIKVSEMSSKFLKKTDIWPFLILYLRNVSCVIPVAMVKYFILYLYSKIRFEKIQLFEIEKYSCGNLVYKSHFC